jgi:hypothetical protein
MKKSYDMSSLPANVIADTSPETSTKFDHVEHTPEPIHEDINSQAPRRSKRPRTTNSFVDDFTFYLVDDTTKTIVEAFVSPDADDWKEAVRGEMDLILSNGTLELVDWSYGRTRSTWYSHCGSWLALWALDRLAYCQETFAGNTYELWQSNSDSQSGQFEGQYEVIKTHQKTVKVYQENEKLWGYYIGLFPYWEEPDRSNYKGVVT